MPDKVTRMKIKILNEFFGPSFDFYDLLLLVGSETKAQEGFADFEQAFANSDQPQSSIESQNRVETKPPISQNPIKASLPPQTQHTTQKASPPISHSPSVSPPHTRGQSPNLPKSQEPVKPSSNLGQQILALQRQLADSNSQNKSLKITLQSQQALIEKLKVNTFDAFSLE